MRYISIEELLELYSLVINRYGGSAGVRDIGRLDAALACQHQSVFGVDVYPTVYSKAAAMMRGVIGDHPFFDGNKRTGTLLAITFLELNDLTFTAKKGEVEDFAVSVATDQLDVDQISQWLEEHCR